MLAGSLHSSWSKLGKGHHVNMCMRPRPLRQCMGLKHCQCIASLCKHWDMSQQRCKSLQKYMCGFPVQTYGKLQGAISLIQRRESKIPAIKFLVLIHSTCPYKNCPQVLPVPPQIILFILRRFSFFQASRHTKKKKIVWKLAQYCI